MVSVPLLLKGGQLRVFLFQLGALGGGAQAKGGAVPQPPPPEQQQGGCTTLPQPHEELKSHLWSTGQGPRWRVFRNFQK